MCIFKFLKKKVVKKVAAAVVAVTITPTIATIIDATKVDVSAPVSYVSLATNNYEDSISADRLCYLSIEASQAGLIYDVVGSYMEIKNNQAPGWNYVCENSKLSGLSWALWQNQYEKGTYCLVYAGTDQLLDTATYIPMMTQEDYCAQMNQAIDVAKQINNLTVSGYPMEKLFIVGHSLGGYLASYVASDIVDKSVSPSDTYSRLAINDISSNLTLSDMKCYTFAAPGFYLGGINLPGSNKEIMSITKWGQEKFNNNKNDAYASYIYNYKNSYDPVANLFISPDRFKHIGNTIEYKITKMSAAQLNSAMKKHGLFNLPQNVLLNTTNVYYHLPHVYINAIRNPKTIVISQKEI